MKYDGFRYYKEFGGDVIKFDVKPPSEVIAALKGNKFRWNPTLSCWRRHRVGPYADLLTWIDKRLHPDRSDGDCKNCGKPSTNWPLLLCNGCLETFLKEK